MCVCTIYIYIYICQDSNRYWLDVTIYATSLILLATIRATIILIRICMAQEQLEFMQIDTFHIRLYFRPNVSIEFRTL